MSRGAGACEVRVVCRNPSRGLSIDRRTRFCRLLRGSTGYYALGLRCKRLLRPIHPHCRRKGYDTHPAGEVQSGPTRSHGKSCWSFLKSGVPSPVTLHSNKKGALSGPTTANRASRQKKVDARIPSLLGRKPVRVTAGRRTLGDVVQSLAAGLVQPRVQETQDGLALREAVVIQERDDRGKGRGGGRGASDCVTSNTAPPSVVERRAGTGRFTVRKGVVVRDKLLMQGSERHSFKK